MVTSSTLHVPARAGAYAQIQFNSGTHKNTSTRDREERGKEGGQRGRMRARLVMPVRAPTDTSTRAHGRPTAPNAALTGAWTSMAE